MVIIAQQSWETTFDMSQDFFSFPNLLIGLMRLSSSDQAVYDPKEIGRFIHQVTGFEYRYAPPGTLESFGGSESSEEVATQQPEPSIPPPPCQQPWILRILACSSQNCQHTPARWRSYIFNFNRSIKNMRGNICTLHPRCRQSQHQILRRLACSSQNCQHILAHQWS